MPGRAVNWFLACRPWLVFFFNLYECELVFLLVTRSLLESVEETPDPVID
jgi:hypothetical protein